MKRTYARGYVPKDWVVLFNGSVVRYRTAGNLAITRRATADEVTVAEEKEQAAQARSDAYRKRQEQPDWRDAMYVLNALEHDTERTIQRLGAEFLHKLAEMLRK